MDGLIEGIVEEYFGYFVRRLVVRFVCACLDWQSIPVQGGQGVEPAKDILQLLSILIWRAHVLIEFRLH